MRVKPAGPDRAIPYEGTRELLPEAGGDVPDTGYWRRRLRDGDVVRVETARASHTAHPAPAPKV